ncbi:Rha family transcriptional regulator [Ottowia sp.]|uniref:Rha family transcriptional regulator n=1 Tax=Ottowia sp. TaxID=1898956 RepID=UPI0039E52534
MIAVIEKRGEARVDSRAVAQALGNDHRSVFKLVRDYEADFEQVGKVRFEISPSPGSATGQNERHALLNEDQAYLLLTYSRNTAKVRGLKVKLVQAFREARLKAELHTEYLPSYHDLHDRMHQLAQGTLNERWAHANLNKLVNQTAGIEPGQRAAANVPHKAMMIAAQHIATQAMQGAQDHHDAYSRAKKALAPLALKRIESSNGA